MGVCTGFAIKSHSLLLDNSFVYAKYMKKVVSQIYFFLKDKVDDVSISFLLRIGD